MSERKVKEFEVISTYAEFRVSKTGKDYVVLVNVFDLGNGRKYTVESFLNNDQQYILGL